MRYIKTFENNSVISIKTDKYLWDDKYQVDYSFYIGDEYIGGCYIETCFKTDNFSDDEPSRYADCDNKFNYKNVVKKSDFYSNRFVIYLYNFEIDSEYQGKGYGSKFMDKVVKSIKRLFPNNDGIYLSVFKDNINAVRIYSKVGFVVIKELNYNEGDVLEMKLRNETYKNI